MKQKANQTQAPADEAQKEVRQITTRNVMGSMAERAFAEKTLLFTVAGVAKGAETGEGETRPFVRLLGDFAAINQETGEVIEAVRAILPGVKGERLSADYLDQCRTAGRGKRPALEFKGEVWAVPRADSEGYELEFIPQIAPARPKNPALALLGK